MLALFAVCAPGLEQITAGELKELGLLSDVGSASGHHDGPGLVHAGGVEFAGSFTDLYKANVHLRTASRVLLRLGDFHAAAFAELRKKAARLPWTDCLRAGQSVTIRATCTKSKLYHSGAVAERVAGAIEDALGAPVVVAKPADEDADNPPQLIVVRIANNHCVISIDSSGELLHRRGYRQALAKAPLRETLAAAVVLASGWDRQSPLIDPFCGSGVIPIEAAMMAGQIPPGSRRDFAFTSWPAFEPFRSSTVRDHASPFSFGAMPSILGADRDLGAVGMAQQNAQRAGVESVVHFLCQAISALEPLNGPGWIVTNPPYGVRISGGKDLRNLYAQLGNVLQRRCHGWKVALLAADTSLLRQTGLKWQSSVSFSTGGIRVQLMNTIVD